MTTWNNEGWKVLRHPFIKVYLHKEKGVAMMVFFARLRLALLNKEDTVKFSAMMDAPNYQIMEAFLLLKGDMKIPV